MEGDQSFLRRPRQSFVNKTNTVGILGSGSFIKASMNELHRRRAEGGFIKLNNVEEGKRRSKELKKMIAAKALGDERNATHFGWEAEGETCERGGRE